jgi:hypothetical protein
MMLKVKLNNLKVRAACSTLHSRNLCTTWNILQVLNPRRWTSVVGGCMGIGWVKVSDGLFILGLQYLKLFGLVCVFALKIKKYLTDLFKPTQI